MNDKESLVKLVMDKLYPRVEYDFVDGDVSLMKSPYIRFKNVRFKNFSSNRDTIYEIKVGDDIYIESNLLYKIQRDMVRFINFDNIGVFYDNK